jgi:hypothetical protein
MAGTAFVVGFFTALGWWSANKLIEKTAGELSNPPVIHQQLIKKGE